MAHLLTEPIYRDNMEQLIDVLVDFFFGGTQTTMNLSLTAIHTSIQDRDLKEKARKDIAENLFENDESKSLYEALEV